MEDQKELQVHQYSGTAHVVLIEVLTVWLQDSQRFQAPEKGKGKSVPQR